MNEEVMVVETTVLAPFLEGRQATIIRDQTDEILQLIAAKNFFVDRAIAEQTPAWRQIIPYVVVRHEDSFFVLRRTPKQNEVRLHNKLSLGIGGHINPGHDLLAGLHKELAEEVQIGGSYDLQFIGILNDESTDVGRVHLGAVYELLATTSAVRVLETEKMTGEWVPYSGLAALRDQMETWSQIVYDQALAS